MDSAANRLVIGLTGGIGVGKSTVAAAMERRGAFVVDVDSLGRSVLESTGRAFEAVVRAFGVGIVDDGEIDRSRLAEQVFGSTDRLRELEAISHPAINEELWSAITLATSATADLVVLDMAVLAESRLGWRHGVRLYQRVIVVEAPLTQRLQRLKERGMSEPEVQARMAAQATDSDRRKLADLVVLNDASMRDLEAELDRFWPTLEAWQSQPARRAGVGE